VAAASFFNASSGLAVQEVHQGCIRQAAYRATLPHSLYDCPLPPSSLPQERFAAKPDEERLVELETLRQYLEEASEAVDKAVASNISAVERMKKLLTAQDKKAMILEMAEVGFAVCFWGGGRRRGRLGHVTTAAAAVGPSQQLNAMILEMIEVVAVGVGGRPLQLLQFVFLSSSGKGEVQLGRQVFNRACPGLVHPLQLLTARKLPVATSPLLLLLLLLCAVGQRDRCCFVGPPAAEH
jgi:hypothetical protein